MSVSLECKCDVLVPEPLLDVQGAGAHVNEDSRVRMAQRVQAYIMKLGTFLRHFFLSFSFRFAVHGPASGLAFLVVS